MPSDPGLPESPAESPQKGGNLFTGRLCTVCRSVDRSAADRALLAGSSERQVAAQFGFSRAAVQRHKRNHISAALKAEEAERAKSEAEASLARARAAQRERAEVDPEEEERLLAHTETLNARAALVAGAARAEDLLGSLSLLRMRALSELERASRSRDHRTAVSAVNAARAILETMAKLTGQLNDGGLTTINIVGQASFITVQQGIIAALEPFPQAKEAVMAALEQMS